MKPQQLFYALLAGLVVLVIGGGVSYYLSHTKLQDKIDTIERLNADTVVAREQLRNLQELEHEYARAEPIEEKIHRVLPEDKMQSEVTAQIFAMIDANGLSGSGLSFDRTDGAPGAQTQTAASGIRGVLAMPVTFNVEGSYRQLLGFLDSVERQERLMQVTSLDIRRSSSDTVLSFNVKLEVFLRDGS